MNRFSAKPFAITLLVALALLAPASTLLAKTKATPKSTPHALVDLNTATEKELETLPGIGTALAPAIVAGRPYTSVEDLNRIKGIGPTTVASLRSKVTVAVPKLAPGEKVNLNTAPREKLEALPEIGALKARSIIKNRPYAKIEDVMKVPGIKESIYKKIKDSITVE
ncbi:MAG: helix-hairpin-helix domain-containing protein [Thermoanaerobaculia bacterium]